MFEFLLLDEKKTVTYKIRARRWNKKLFPDPEGFMRQLHDRGLQISLNTHPADGIQSFEDLYVPMCDALGRDPSTGQVRLPVTESVQKIGLMPC